MKILGIVTARGGSKRIPQKSIVPICGKPIMAHVLLAFKKSKLVNRVIVDTDSSEMAEVGKEYGAEIPYMRPKELAQDSTSHVDVLKNSITTLREKENYEPDIVVLIQPTSPLVRGEQIDEMVKILLDSGPDSVEAIFEVPKIFHPHNVRYVNENGDIKFLMPKEHAEFKQTRLLPKIYATGNFYAFRPQNLWDVGNIHGKISKALIIPREYAVDIDEPVDVAIAEAMTNWINKEK